MYLQEVNQREQWGSGTQKPLVLEDVLEVVDVGKEELSGPSHFSILEPLGDFINQGGYQWSCFQKF